MQPSQGAHSSDASLIQQFQRLTIQEKAEGKKEQQTVSQKDTCLTVSGQNCLEFGAKFAQRFPHCTSLDMSNTQISDSDLEAIGVLPLTDVNISGNDDLTDIGMYHFLKRCRSIHTLCIGSFGLTLQSIRLIVDFLPKIRALSLNNFGGTTDQELGVEFDQRVVLQLEPLKHLRHLNVSNVLLTNEALKMLAQTQPKLQTLILRHDRRKCSFNSQTLQCLTAFTKLKVLELDGSWLRDPKNQVVQMIPKTFPQARVLPLDDKSQKNAELLKKALTRVRT